MLIDENWVELGYLLSKEQLNTPTLNPSTMKSSIDNLIRQSSPYTMDDLIRG